LQRKRFLISHQSTGPVGARKKGFKRGKESGAGGKMNSQDVEAVRLAAQLALQVAEQLVPQLAARSRGSRKCTHVERRCRSARFRCAAASDAASPAAIDICSAVCAGGNASNCAASSEVVQQAVPILSGREPLKNVQTDSGGQRFFLAPSQSRCASILSPTIGMTTE